MHKISDVFYENIYHIFVEYCSKNNLFYMKELDNFNFELLKDVRGLGISKINSIISKYNSYKNNDLEENILNKINPQNYDLSIESLMLFGISRNIVDTLLKKNIKTIIMLKEYGNSNLYKYNHNIYKKIIKALNNYMQPITDIIPKLLSDFKSEDHYEVILKRAKSITLSKIGEDLKVTRERIRQIEGSMLKMAKIILDIVLTLIKNQYNYKSCINLNRLEQYFTNEEDLLVMKYTLSIMYKDYYLDFCNKLLINGEKVETVLEKLNGITDYYIKDVINFTNKIVVISDSLSKNNLPYIDVEDLTNYLLLNGYIKKGNYIFKSGISYGLLCTIVIKNYFKNGIRIHDEKDLDRLRKLVYVEFDGLELPDNNRALGTRISFFLVLCDRGKYTVSSNIKIEPDLLNEIYEYIFAYEGSTLFFNDIFVHFKDKLSKASNITNRYFMQGILKYYFEDDFIFERDSLTKKGHKRKNIRMLISEFILDKKRPVHRKEIKAMFPGATDVVITNAQISNKSILQWEYNYYIHIDNLNITTEDKYKIDEVLNSLFDKFMGYCSEQILFDTVINLNLDIIKKNYIRNASNLFYLTSYLFKDKYLFRRPHILKDNNIDQELSSRTVVERFLIKDNIFKYSDYQAFVSELRWSIGTAYAVFKDLEKDIVRISEDEYIIKNKFSISKGDINKIFSYLENEVSVNEYISINKFKSFDKLPKIQYDWNPYILSSIIQLYNSNNLKIISPQVEDRRYVKEIIIDKRLNIDSYEKLIIYVIKKNKLSSSTLYHLETILSSKGLIGRYLPKELYNSKNIYIEDDRFYTV